MSYFYFNFAFYYVKPYGRLYTLTRKEQINKIYILSVNFPKLARAPFMQHIKILMLTLGKDSRMELVKKYDSFYFNRTLSRKKYKFY